jgi:hypothetical protein
MSCYLQASRSSRYSFCSSRESALKASVHSLVIVESALLPRPSFSLQSQAPGAPQEKRIKPAAMSEKKNEGFFIFSIHYANFCKETKNDLI